MGSTRPPVPHFSTNHMYLCLHKLKTEVIMWIAIMISVFLCVEILTYLSEEKIKAEGSGEKIV